MSLERILKIFADRGLTKREIRIYIYLSKNGPKKAQEISDALQINKKQFYQSISKLKKSQLITTKTERVSTYTAITFEKTVDLLIKSKVAQAKEIKENKINLMEQLKSLRHHDTID